jgi:hypothetical protein
MASNNDLAKNNAELKDQYEKLSLEIEENSKLMENQLEEKNKTTGSIEDDIK